VILTEDIDDPEDMPAHSVVPYDSLVAHSAKMLIVDDEFDARERSLVGGRIAVIEFESVEWARSCYESEAG
jgi:uncharacterized protein (DUF1330 family)